MTGLRIIRPSETSLRMVWRELALLISLTSLGSSQILRLPQPMTEAARRFCVRRLALGRGNHVSLLLCHYSFALLFKFLDSRSTKEGQSL